MTPLLVISCDRYADLWRPFFAVFWHWWPDCPYRVYLGTNFKVHPDERVTSIPIGRDISWTSGLQRMLDHVQSEYVILFLEDFLIRCEVDTSAVERLVTVARERRLGCLRLAALLPLAFPPSEPVGELPGLGVISPEDPYRVSLQVAVWRVDVLRSLLVPGLNAWEFEELGTQLSRRMADSFWATYRPAISYVQAVEKGKWKPEGLAVCLEGGVPIDRQARLVYTEEELDFHYRAVGDRGRRRRIKHEAISSFRAGRRIDGVRHILRCLRREPFSMQLCGIAFFGLLGAAATAWIQEQHLRLKIAALRKRERRASEAYDSLS